MENTGHYHYPVLKAFQEAGLPVCMVNAYQIKKFGDMDLRKAKTDKKDAVRIARYALEKSYSLVPYTSMEQKYEDLRFLARQYNQRMLTLKTNKVFLLNLLDETMPGITNILPLTTRTPETSLSVLFINRFKSYDRIKKMLHILSNIVLPLMKLLPNRKIQKISDFLCLCFDPNPYQLSVLYLLSALFFYSSSNKALIIWFPLSTY